MKQLLAIVAVLTLMVGVKAVPPASLTTEGSSALSTFLGDAVARGDVPGVVALVVDRDKVLYHEAFGKMNVAKNAPMAKDTIFRIASMTKAVTSVGVMQLIEQGKLGLDDDVSKYLPRLKSPQVFSKVDEQAGTGLHQEAGMAEMGQLHSAGAYSRIGNVVSVQQER